MQLMTRPIGRVLRLWVFALAAWLGVTASETLAMDETLVMSGAACRYRVPADESLGTNWVALTFDDSAWSLGASGVGYDTEMTYAELLASTVPVHSTAVYTRFAFAVPAGKAYETLTLRVKYDDGFIAYLNGVEVARSNAPEGAGAATPASAGHDDGEAVVFQDFDLSPSLLLLGAGTNVLAIHALNLSASSDFLILPELAAGLQDSVSNLVINEFMALNDTTLKNSLGKYEDWVELYNPFPTNVSLAGWYLTDNAGKLNKWQFPASPLSVVPAKGYRLIWVDNLDKAFSVTNGELHASFALSGGGEYLALVKPDGVTVVSSYAPTFPPQLDDLSYGLGSSGENRFFAVATPGGGNAFSSPSNEVASVSFSPKRGVYTNAVPPVAVSLSTAGAQIRYTLDAEAPTLASSLYTAPFVLSHTAVIRAAGFKSGLGSSGVDTHTYIVADDVLAQPAVPAGWPMDWNETPADYGMDSSVVASAGAALTNALTVLPTLSVVTPQANLFDPTTGLYVNPYESGADWERACSAEWIDTDNSSRFQIDCGLRIQGGAFRGMDLTRKKSFSLRFRGIYGESVLKENLFGGDAVATFNDLVLRGGANDAWDSWGHENTQYIVDEFVRRSHLAMGGISPLGRFVHLYLNGLYWGLYNVTEHVSSDFAASYCDGQKGTWDVRSQDGPLDGDGAAWDEMLGVLADRPESNATYQKVQGNNPNGTRNPAYPIYLDVENYIDYMIVQYWSANGDWPWNNYRAFRNRNNSLGSGFKFSVWDAEAGMGIWGGLGTDQTGNSEGVAVIQGLLSGNAEYRLRFADRVQKHFFNGGPLMAAFTIPRYQALADEIEPALVAESARWGDQDGNAAHTVEQWRAQRDYVLKTFLTQRNAEVLQQFRNRGLFPSVDAPVFSRYAGLFTNTFSLTMSAAQPIYYTLDGRDPRRYGTGAPAGIRYTNGVVLASTARVKARARSTAGVWSAATEALFTLAEMPDLRVSELMFHPRSPASASGEGYPDGDDEFIELRNAGASRIGLAGLHFTEGVLFDFTAGTVPYLNPGDHVLVVKNIAAFTNRYPSVPPQRIAGAFVFPSTSLDDAGESIRIEDAAGRTVVRFAYSNRWRVEADGAGHSLVPADVPQSNGELNYSGNWKASVFIGGSPGQAEPAVPAPSVVLNEILAHTDTNSLSNDGIELYNGTALPITFGAGWYLSDDPANPAKWAIPATNVIAAHGWRYFDEVHDFHNPITNGFGLNQSGEQVLLSYLPGAAGVDRVVDAVSFGAQENNQTLARYPDGAEAWLDGSPTPGDSNRLAGAGVVIDEVMYHPRPATDNPENGDAVEYVELFNPTLFSIDLTSATNEGGGLWRLAGGIGYSFPSNTALPAGGRLVIVPFDPATDEAAKAVFLSAYNLTEGQIRMLGPYSGHLDDRTDSVRLERPVSPVAAGEDVSWHGIDQVTYSDAAPWPVEAAGSGRPLQRRIGRNSGVLPSSWNAGFIATPGEGPVKIRITEPTSGMGYLAPFSTPVRAEVDSGFVVGAVSRVEFFDGAALVSTDLTEPYGFSLDSLTNAGEHDLTARLIDEAGTNTSPAVRITVYTNTPTADAGANRRINIAYNNSLSLSATLSDNGFPTQRVTTTWSLESGPGSVTFSDPSNLQTTVTFSTPGTSYVLRLTTVFDNMISTSDFVTVSVVNTNKPNRIPFRESFEKYQAGDDLAGLDGWNADRGGIAKVTASSYTNTYPGTYPIPGPHQLLLRGSGGAFSNRFQKTQSVPDVWVDVIIQGPHFRTPRIPAPKADVQVAFCVNSNGHLVVWNHQSAPAPTNGWTELPDTSLAPDEFVRLTAQVSYTNLDASGFPRFRVWVGGVPVTNPAAWFSAASKDHVYMSQLAVRGPASVDDVIVDDHDPMGTNLVTAAIGPGLTQRLSSVAPDSPLNLDSDSDGMTAWKEYVAGTDPTNPSSVFNLQLCVSNGELVVLCPTIPAGAEYGGLARYYALESTTDLVAGAWAGIAGWTNILGLGQTLIYTNPPSSGKSFFRGRVLLK